MRDTVIATTSADPKFSNATMVLTRRRRVRRGSAPFSGNRIAQSAASLISNCATRRAAAPRRSVRHR
jgi:hypothetical protein